MAELNGLRDGYGPSLERIERRRDRSEDEADELAIWRVERRPRSEPRHAI